MDIKALSTKRINVNYALLQGFFWMANASIGAFTVVYLTYRGLNNLQIGVTSSLNCFAAIIMQIVVADFLDKHMKVPIRKVIALFFAIGILLGGVLIGTDLPAIGTILVFAGCCSILSMANGLISAQMMQYSNVGIQADFGWPRGFGSLCYAVSSIVYGSMAEKYSPGVLPIFFLIMMGACVVIVLAMPNPYAYIDPIEYAKEHNAGEVEHTSYRKMLLTNGTLLMALICVIIYSVGQSAALTFMVRMVEQVGCGTKEYGITEFVRAGVEVPMLFASAYVLRKMSSKTAMVISLFASAARIYVIAFAGSMTSLYVASAMNILCSGIYVFASVLFVNEIVRPTEKVRAQALIALFYSIGSVLGNALSGALIDSVGLQATMITNGSICVLSGVLFMVFVRKKK